MTVGSSVLKKRLPEIRVVGLLYLSNESHKDVGSVGPPNWNDAGLWLKVLTSGLRTFPTTRPYLRRRPSDGPGADFGSVSPWVVRTVPRPERRGVSSFETHFVRSRQPTTTTETGDCRVTPVVDPYVSDRTDDLCSHITCDVGVPRVNMVYGSFRS